MQITAICDHCGKKVDGLSIKDWYILELYKVGRNAKIKDIADNEIMVCSKECLFNQIEWLKEEIDPIHYCAGEIKG